MNHESIYVVQLRGLFEQEWTTGRKIIQFLVTASDDDTTKLFRELRLWLPTLVKPVLSPVLARSLLSLARVTDSHLDLTGSPPRAPFERRMRRSTIHGYRRAHKAAFDQYVFVKFLWLYRRVKAMGRSND